MHSSLSFNPLILRSFTASLICRLSSCIAGKYLIRNRQRYNNPLWQMPFSQAAITKNLNGVVFSINVPTIKHGNIFLAYTVKIINITANTLGRNGIRKYCIPSRQANSTIHFNAVFPHPQIASNNTSKPISVNSTIGV